jgi:hypothetical protein
MFGARSPVMLTSTTLLDRSSLAPLSTPQSTPLSGAWSKQKQQGLDLIAIKKELRWEGKFKAEQAEDKTNVPSEDDWSVRGVPADSSGDADASADGADASSGADGTDASSGADVDAGGDFKAADTVIDDKGWQGVF